MGLKKATFDTAQPDLDTDGGITLSGTYTTHTGKPGVKGEDFQVTVTENGITTVLSGVFAASGGKWFFFADAGQLSAASLQNGDQIVFTITNTKSGETVGTSSTLTLCLYPGTMVSTPEGEVAVETLSIGDLVIRADGQAAPIRWVGRNTVSMTFADKMKTLPIRIRKDALAENVPTRDLLVSPDHAVLVDGILVQAGALVNDTSIIRETAVPNTFVYYHIELADHSLIMTENTATETFIDNVDRMAFDNWAEHEALYGDEAGLVEMDLPRAKSQRQIPAATRKRLAERATALGYVAVAAA